MTVLLPRTNVTTASPIARSCGSDDARDRGVSLVEVLVAVVLIGITGTAVLGAMAASARASAVGRTQAASIVWLQSAADHLSKSPYEGCATPASAADPRATYEFALRAASAPPSPIGWPKSGLSVESVTYWNPATRSFDAGCTTSQVQRVVLRASNPAEAFATSLVVVRSCGVWDSTSRTCSR